MTRSIIVCSTMMRSTLALVVALTTLVVVVPLTAGPASAQQGQPAEEFATVQLDVVGFSFGDPGQAIDATVTVSSERPVAGTLVVLDEPRGGAPTTWEFDVDQAAGTTTTYPLILASGWDGVQASARLESGGQLIAEDEAQRFPEPISSSGFVAMIGIDDAPPRLTELGTGDTLTVFENEASSSLLARSSSVVGTSAAIRDLDGTDLGDALEAWVRGGGQLVVDGPDESLAGRWHVNPTGNPSRFLVGAGSVLYETEWRAGIPIGGYSGRWQLQQRAQEQQLGSGAAAELALIADVGLPRPGVVAGVLLGYAVLAGPVLYAFSARRGTQRRLWIVLPVVSALVAAVILGIGLLNSQGRTDAHITIVDVGATGSQATTNVLVGSRFGSTREISTPPSWRYLGQETSVTARAVRLRPDTTSTRVAVDLPPSGNATLRLSGPAAGYDGALRFDDIEVSEDGVVISATVVNASGVDLTDAVGFLGNERVTIGEIPAGESVNFVIERNVRQGRMMRELLLWPRVGISWGENGPIASPNDPNDDSPVEAGAWTAWRIDQGIGAVPDHVIGVAAWTDDLDAPIGGIEKGNTALFVREVLPASVLGGNWVSSVYEPMNQQQPPMMQNNFFGWSQNYRFVATETIDPDTATLQVGREAAGVSILVDDEWLHAKLPDEAGNLTISLPGDVDGLAEIAAQTWVAEWNWNAERTLFLSPDDPGRDDAIEVEWSTDQSFREGDGPFFEPEFRGPVNVSVDEIVVEDLEPGAGVAFDGEVGGGEYISYIVELEAGQSVTVTLRGLDGDPMLELFDDRGTFLAANDDFGEGLDSRLEYTSDSDATVEFRAQGLGGAPLAFAVELEVTE